MKIRTKLYVNAGVSVILVASLALFMLLESYKISDESRQYDLVKSTHKAVADLDSITYEYLLYKEKRMVEEWHAKYHTAGKYFNNTVSNKLPNSLKYSYDDLGRIFSQLTENSKNRAALIREGADHKYIEVAEQREKRLVARWLESAQSILTDSYRLSEKYYSEGILSLEYSSYLIFSLVAILALIVIVMSVLVARSISAPLESLTKGVEYISAGDLDYRIPQFGKDETGKLSQAFNQMTLQLKEARSGLERKVIERTQELGQANQALEDKTQRLLASEKELKQQSEELRVSNEELEQQREVLKKASDDLEIKAKELSLVSQYKSEFLANMSHELRTPLNSLLILSKHLADNNEGNLTEAQIEDARVINEGGRDLLNLINDIMDLSKVEAGMLSTNIEQISLEDVTRSLEKLFAEVAIETGVSFIIEQDDNVPRTMPSDEQRLKQILKNFLANAFKFTEKGSVTLKIHRAAPDTRFSNTALLNSETIGFSVIDTGIGIGEAKQEAIFQAFHQEDGSTSRKYGGTGLGLTISKELARLLGGEIKLASAKNIGSAFTLYLPLRRDGVADADNKTGYISDNKAQGSSQAVGAGLPASEYSSIAGKESISAPPMETFIADDRGTVHEGEKSILIIEDDVKFAKILLSIAQNRGFKCLVTDKGRDGLYLAKEYLPCGIFLDMGLPDIGGITVLEQLKYDLKTRHIPVHVISGGAQQRASLKEGAVSYLHKPASEEEIATLLSSIESAGSDSVKRLLLVDDDQGNQHAVQGLLASKGLEIVIAATGKDACNELESEHFDCIILDLGLPDISGYEVLKKINALPGPEKPPVIIYTEQAISDQEQLTLSEFAADIIIKGAESPERLLDNVSLFLHSVTEKLPEDQKTTIQMLHDEDAMLRGRRILLVDDDMRNVFALTRQLEDAGLDVTMADNGQAALDQLAINESESGNPIELIIMDIMMPVMDGYEAIQKIRGMDRYADIPIIALTAKAMPEDRAKCIEAGASEYLMKPVDIEKMFSVMRVWLYKHD